MGYRLKLKKIAIFAPIVCTISLLMYIAYPISVASRSVASEGVDAAINWRGDQLVDLTFSSNIAEMEVTQREIVRSLNDGNVIPGLGAGGNLRTVVCGDLGFSCDWKSYARTPILDINLGISGCTAYLTGTEKLKIRHLQKLHSKFDETLYDVNLSVTNNHFVFTKSFEKGINLKMRCVRRGEADGLVSNLSDINKVYPELTVEKSQNLMEMIQSIAAKAK